MSETKNPKSKDLKSNKPVQKASDKNKGGTTDKSAASKGKSGKEVPSSPTTEVNPEG